MVHDHISHASEYFNLSQGIRTALEYLACTDLGALPEGRHAVDGDRVFALVSDYQTRLPEEAFWEAHRLHVDVQFVVLGRERIAYANLDRFEADPYDAERDLTVARGDAAGQVPVGAGEFVILFPRDVHMPGLQVDGPVAVRKVVVKVRLDGR
jgi:YhcH/YjgK/YiaL family protein